MQSETSQAKMDLYVSTPDQLRAEIFFISLYMGEGEIIAGPYERTSPYAPHTVCADPGVDVQLCVCLGNSYHGDSSDSSFSHQGNHSVPVGNWTGPLKYVHTETSALEGSYKHNVEMQKAVLTKPSKIESQQLSPGLNTENLDSLIKSMINQDMNVTVFTYKVKSTACLHIIKESNSAGVIYTSFNACNLAVKVQYRLAQDNLVQTTVSVKTTQLYPGGVKFLCGGVVRNPALAWQSTFHLHVL